MQFINTGFMKISFNCCLQSIFILNQSANWSKLDWMKRKAAAIKLIFWKPGCRVCICGWIADLKFVFISIPAIHRAKTSLPEWNQTSTAITANQTTSLAGFSTIKYWNHAIQHCLNILIVSNYCYNNFFQFDFLQQTKLQKYKLA